MGRHKNPNSLSHAMRLGLDRICTCCGNFRLAAEFYKGSRRCKACEKERARTWPSKPRPKTPEGRKEARLALNRAKRDGLISAWPACAMPCCSVTSELEAHHADYSAPLAVVWLCKKHHAEAHATTKQALADVGS